MNLIYGEDIDRRLNWPLGRAERLARRGGLPHVVLPDGNGFDVLAKIRRHPVLSSLPVVMLTAKDDAADIGKGLLLGADGRLVDQNPDG